MAIVVETGAGSDQTANSYVTLAEARTLAAAMGLTLPAVDADAEKAILGATRYLDGFRARFQGHTSNGAEQALTWPRRLVSIDGTTIDDDVIPLLVKKAQVAAAAEIGSGTNLFENTDGKFLKRDKTDVLESEWSEKIFTTPDGKPAFPAIDGYLLPLLRDDAGAKLTARHGF
ncbi:MAG: BcepGomr09 [Marmoricola sp.]|nr:BcepGomr09 [Marmoricola sp.]